MWIDTATLAAIVGKTPRAIQHACKQGRYKYRSQGRKMEVDSTSLPKEMQDMVARSTSASKAVSAKGGMKDLALPTTLGIASQSVGLEVLARQMSPKQRRKLQIVSKYKQRPADVSIGTWISTVADFFGVSESTVRRAVDEYTAYGIKGKPMQSSSAPIAWDPKAIEYMGAYYLKAIKEIGQCTKITAFRAVQKKAKIEGWKVGSKTSAYDYLNELHPLLERSARGIRDIDNYFWILRDLDTLAPFQVVVGDQHIFDWWVADYEEGRIYRPECYVWLDMCTRLPYGIAFDKKYSSHTVKEALRVGLHRFGQFGCTYNDNGSSECSAAFNEIIDDLTKFDMKNKDISDLYQSADGTYVVLDEDDHIVDTAASRDEWKKKQKRRIFARVKNAKAKPIERFFRTLEARLDEKCIPGRVKTPNAPAHIEEAEKARLEKQKEKRELLTIEEFVSVVLHTLILDDDSYENSDHQGIGMTPRQKLYQKQQEGWRARFMPQDDIDFILYDRTRRKVNRGRVSIGTALYEGEPVRLADDGTIAKVGITEFEGDRIEVRYDRWDMSKAWAVVPSKENTVRPLKRVEAISMLDDDAAAAANEWKRNQIKAVRQAFDMCVKPIGTLMVKSQEAKRLYQAKQEFKQLPDVMDINLEEEVQKRLEENPPKKTGKIVNFRPVHLSESERYKWCLDVMIAGGELEEVDKRFVQRFYETRGADERAYWDTYKALAEGGNA